MARLLITTCMPDPATPQRERADIAPVVELHVDDRRSPCRPELLHVHHLAFVHLQLDGTVCALDLLKEEVGGPGPQHHQAEHDGQDAARTVAPDEARQLPGLIFG
jgi:hypothetical protein